MKGFSRIITILTISMLLFSPLGTWGQKPPAISQPRQSGGPDIYRIEVRVIFADETGIHGEVPRELSDMRRILNKRWNFPSYILSNTIHLSLFSDDEAVAMVFPEHYLRLIPKGSAGETLKLKAELYHAEDEREIKTKVYAGRLDDAVNPDPDGEEGPVFSLPQASVEEHRVEGRHDTVFPIISSAVLASEDDWDAFGGVPVYVNSQQVVQSNRLSTSSLDRAHHSQPLGARKYLLLGVKLADE